MLNKVHGVILPMYPRDEFWPYANEKRTAEKIRIEPRAWTMWKKALYFKNFS